MISLQYSYYDAMSKCDLGEHEPQLNSGILPQVTSLEIPLLVEDRFKIKDISKTQILFLFISIPSGQYLQDRVQIPAILLYILKNSAKLGRKIKATAIRLNQLHDTLAINSIPVSAVSTSSSTSSLTALMSPFVIPLRCKPLFSIISCSFCAVFQSKAFKQSD